MENLAAILSHRGKKIYLTKWREGLKNLTVIENKILDARLNGLSFSEFTETQVTESSNQIILSCCALVGCEIPFTEKFLDAVSENIGSFILEFGYENLTLAEIILALKLNLQLPMKMPTGLDIEEVNFTGRCVNVVFLARVLKNYYSIRHLLDRKIQNLVDETNNF